LVKVAGDAFRALLDQRQQIILSILQEADAKADAIKKQLGEASKSLEVARLRAKEICVQADASIEQENEIIKQQLKDDLIRVESTGRIAIKLKRQQTVKAIAQQVADLALATSEKTLLTMFDPYGPTRSNPKELNELHVSETFGQLKIPSVKRDLSIDCKN